MNQHDTKTSPLHPSDGFTAPAQTKRKPVKYWVGPTWEITPGGLVLVHPGSPRRNARASAVNTEQSEAIQPTIDHAAIVTTTSMQDPSSTDGAGIRKERRGRRHSVTKTEAAPVPLENRRWLTVKETARRYPYTESALRHLIFQAEQYAKHPKSGLKSNGFLDCIVRPEDARRILIDAEKFELWLQGKGK